MDIKITLHIRETAPVEEVRSALEKFAADYGKPDSKMTNSKGEIHLWSQISWMVGTVEYDTEPTNEFDAELKEAK